MSNHSKSNFNQSRIYLASQSHLATTGGESAVTPVVDLAPPVC